MGPRGSLGCGVVSGFVEVVAGLIGRLENEAALGVRDDGLDREIELARAMWTTLDAEQKAANRGLASQLGQQTKARPSAPPLEDDGWFAALENDGARSEYDASQGEYAAAERTPVANPFAHLYDGPAEPEALLAHMGLAGFRPGQRRAVQAALAGRDSLVVMPTGGGKSLCYQLPGLVGPKLTVVVTPLIALMADQLRRLTDGGHPAVMVASGMTEEAGRASFDALRLGHARIVFCSPERFASASFLRLLEQRGVDLFVIDEAHCLSEWGHDFRPDYLRLPAVIERLGRPTVMAATATATEAVAEEIVSRLGLRDPELIRSGFDRPNLSFDVLQFEGKGTMDAKRATLAGALTDPELTPAIVYCGTRKDCESVAQLLRGDGHSAAHYHAGLNSEARTAVQAQFMSGALDVIVATNAFGMGVDKADVRLVCHWAMPTSVEAYYQEAGRGGRDGLPARALLLASRADLSRLIHFNQQRAIEPETVAGYYQRRLVGRADQNGVIEMDAPENDDDRVSLAIVERAGAAHLEPIGGRQLRVTLSRPLDGYAVGRICQETKNRGWKAYKAIEAYAFGEGCRRRTLLDHFGDATPVAPLGRCCDVCDPELGFNAPKALKRARSSSRTGASSGGAGKPRADEPPLNADPVIYDALVAWRREAAADKPAYTVANNRTLETIADVKPATAAQLQAIKGVGPAFIERYAADVLAIVAGD